MSRRSQTLDRLAAILLISLLAGLGCAGVGLSQPERFHFFATPDRDDPWSAKIRGWQRRERADQSELFGALPAVAEAAAEGQVPVEPTSEPNSAEPNTEPNTEGSTEGEPNLHADGAPPADVEASLRGEYLGFLTQRKRATARDFAAWVQQQAKQHYIADGPIDHWATLEETLRRDGDDCDGLELLAFHGLRDLGFGEDEVFRSIVYRPSDGQHHMVTLWFEDADDPWVIDPTGAMTTGMPRMSQLPEWVPLKLFTEGREFSVARGLVQRDTRSFASTP